MKAQPFQSTNLQTDHMWLIMEMENGRETLSPRGLVLEDSHKGRNTAGEDAGLGLL